MSLMEKAESAEKTEGKYTCSPCAYETCKQQNWNKHILTVKHNRRSLGEKAEQMYTCSSCVFHTIKRCHWNDHLQTKKHIASTCADEPVNKYTCTKCDYMTHKTDRWNQHLTTVKHMRPDIPVTSDSLSSNEMIQNLLTENAEFKQIISKILEHNSATLATALEAMNKPTTVNSHSNNRFNINVFLNEKCANAQNMSDFIAGIEVTHEDLENNAHLGFVGGMVKIFKDNLDKLAITERPIHCTDSKRDTLYIKDNDQWSKDGSTEKMNECIQTISRRGVGNLMSWKRENAEEYKDINSAFSDKCFQIHRTLMAGDDRDTLYPKVVRAIADQVSLHK